MRSRFSFILIILCGIALTANAQPTEKVPAKDAWLYAHNGSSLPRKVSKEKFDKVRYGMTLEEMVKLLGKAWMRPNSSIREIYWGCEDGRVIRVSPGTGRKDEKVVQGKEDELSPGATMQMFREKNGKVEDIPVPSREEKKDKKADPSQDPKSKPVDAAWQRPWYKAQEPRKLKPELFDQVRSGMTMGELVDLLGPIWLSSVGASNIILWRCEDGRELRADPVRGVKDEVFRVDGGRDGIGKLWMTQLKDGRMEEVPIPTLSAQHPVPANEKKAVEALEKVGARFHRDDRQMGKPVIGVDFFGNAARVRDEHLSHLREFKALQALDLSHTQVTDAGLKELRELKNLQTLALSNTKVTDAGLQHLQELKELKSLSLANSKLTDQGLQHLRELKNLQLLDFTATSVTDEGLKELRALKGLTTLELTLTQVTDAGLSELRDLANLTALYLRFTKVSDAGLKDLGKIKGLQLVALAGTQVTAAGARELRKALPKCMIQLR